jgi:hypothetical protein
VDLRKVAAIAASGAVAAAVTAAALGANLGLLESAGAEPVGQLNVTHILTAESDNETGSSVDLGPAASLPPTVVPSPTTGTTAGAPVASTGPVQAVTGPSPLTTATTSTVETADDSDHDGESEPHDGGGDGRENDD